MSGVPSMSVGRREDVELAPVEGTPRSWLWVWGGWLFCVDEASHEASKEE